MAVTSAPQTFTYDVFLSFRGPDTRHNFVGYLHKALTDSGIYTFIDEENLDTGADIMPRLKEAIESSRIAITVLSQDYASSPACLTELLHILKRFKGIKDRLVFPVFYKVTPFDVKNRNGSYRQALAKLDERFLGNRKKWEVALRRVAKLSGFPFKEGEGYEYKFIRKIIEKVSEKLGHGKANIHVADYPVGQSQVVKVRELLDIGSDDIRMVGIYGVGGVGKSTLAAAVYNLISDQFDDSCFLQNVREGSNKHGLKHLQSVILSQMVANMKINLASEQQGASIIQNRLKRKKVLLILDDVDEHVQLHRIVGRPEWFGRGSRIIITTRDKQLLASHGFETTYEVKKLEKRDALQLLNWKAFRREEVDPNYMKVLNEVLTYACGLPLALEVIGSNLFEKYPEEWKSAIERYRRIPNNRILNILKVSFDALGEEEQSVFLDIACCLKEYTKGQVEEILRDLYGHCMKHNMKVLIEKSLIKISDDGKVVLHDLIEHMGKEIDRLKSPKVPGKRKRLWAPEDIIQVLKYNTGTSKIEIICGNFTQEDEVKEKVELDENVFEKMKNLKILIIKNGNFSKRPGLPASVKFVEWQETMS